MSDFITACLLCFGCLWAIRLCFEWLVRQR